MKQINRKKIDTTITLVKSELNFAISKFPAFHSEHEAFAVLKEEVDELWEAVKMRDDNPERKTHIRNEAVQVAAMAIRLIHDRVTL